MENKKTYTKLFPTTFGLFLEWYFELGTWLHKEDVTPEFLEKRIGHYFENSPNKTNKIDRFFGFEKHYFGDNWKMLSDFIKFWFNIPIYIYQYDLGDLTKFVTFHIGGFKFDIECCDDWGEYNFNVDAIGCKIREQ